MVGVTVTLGAAEVITARRQEVIQVVAEITILVDTTPAEAREVDTPQVSLSDSLTHSHSQVNILPLISGID